MKTIKEIIEKALNNEDITFEEFEIIQKQESVNYSKKLDELEVGDIISVDPQFSHGGDYKCIIVDINKGIITTHYRDKFYKGLPINPPYGYIIREKFYTNKYITEKERNRLESIELLNKINCNL